MFERYTENARRTIFFARYEASQRGSNYIEPEHLLVGILREDDGVRALLKGISVKEATSKLALPLGEKIATSVDLPISHSSKLVLAYGAEEAQRLAHKHIGTSHLLLGLLREESRAAEFLRDQGVEIEAVRNHAAAEAEAPPESSPVMKKLRGILQGRVTSSRVEDPWRVVDSEHNVGGHRIRLTERMMLSEDGKRLHYIVEIHGPDGQEHRHAIEFETEPRL